MIDDPETESATATAPPAKAAGRKRRSAIAPEETERPDRRRDILLSAEALFAERGYAAVSVRDIAAKAGVPLALVGYYFGRKPELFATVFEHRKGYIAERIARIEAVDCSPANPDAITDLVRAWAEPVIAMRASPSGEAFSLLVARTVWDPGPEATGVIEQFYDPLARCFIERLAGLLPDCPRERIVWAYEYALGALLMQIADQRVERLSGGAAKSGDRSLAENFIRFIGAGFHSL